VLAYKATEMAVEEKVGVILEQDKK